MNLSSLTMGKIFETVFTSLLLCTFFTVICTKLAVKTKLVDLPSSEPHKQHQKAVPLSGGPAFFLTLLVSSILLRDVIGTEMIKLLAAATIIFIFGLWDDYRPLKPYQKIIGQLLGTGLLISLGIQAQVVSSFQPQIILNQTLAQILDVAITALWMVFITNAYNLIDSMDGLMVGLSAWTSGFYLLAATDTHQWGLAIFCAIMLGSCILLSFFNARPAFIFLGDSGAQTIGFLLAAIAILYNPLERLQSNTWFMPILMLGVPIFDTVLVIFSRTRRGLHFYSSGTDHTYHRLVKMGLSNVQAVQLMQVVAAGMQILAFLVISQTPRTANIIFGMVVLCGLFGIAFLESEKSWEKKPRETGLPKG